MSTIKRFLKNEEGLETVEYAVMTALIVAGLVGAIGILSTAVQGRMTTTATTIDGIGSGGGSSSGTP